MSSVHALRAFSFSTFLVSLESLFGHCMGLFISETHSVYNSILIFSGRGKLPE